jgi:regulation of enolase protein 1 (concanavalin A-like superfamily)
VNNTGMTVGHFDPPFAERTIVHSGRQAMYMHYDNDGTVNEGTSYEKTGTLLYSEAQRQWADAQDWTKSGVNSLTLWFRGLQASVGSFTVGPPMKMTAAGADIFGASDQFYFAYKRLSGDGRITVKVVSLTNTNPGAKAGVMIRESLAPDSAHVMAVVTPGQGIALFRRTTAAATTELVGSQFGLKAPYWVRLTRSGNTFTAERSINGTLWTALRTTTMPILADVYIGLCLTSRDVNATCTAEFSGLATSNNVTGDWQSQDIGIKSNIASQVYVALQDSAGNIAVVKHSDPSSSAISTWTEWNIPLSNFTGVNLLAIKTLSIGVGDRFNPQKGGSGDLYIDDIRLFLP